MNGSYFDNDLIEKIYPYDSENYYWNIAKFSIVSKIMKNINIVPKNGLSIGCGKGIDIYICGNLVIIFTV